MKTSLSENFYKQRWRNHVELVSLSRLSLRDCVCMLECVYLCVCVCSKETNEEKAPIRLGSHSDDLILND